MNIEKYLEDACVDLIVRKHVYNCSHIFKAADHILYMWVWEHVHYTVYMGESTGMGRNGNGRNVQLGPSKQTAKTGVWFGEMERKVAKLSKTTFTYRSSS
jgi:hypothetical protein